MNKDTLVMLADKLMFTMDDKEYDTLLDEFEVILRQMDLIGNIPNINEVLPLVYINEFDNLECREDVCLEEMPIDDILRNSSSNLYNQVMVKKVVE